MADPNPNYTTLTHRFAALQIKMWHIQFRMKQVYENQKQLNKKRYKSNRAVIKGQGPAIFAVIDMLITFEYLEDMMGDILSTSELRNTLSTDYIKLVGQTKNIAARWKAVRNVFGGHIDLEVVEHVCVKHGFKGTLLSEDLETDIAIYNCLLLEGAINEGRKKSDLFQRDLDFARDLSGELKLVVEKLNSDWEQVFNYFQPIIEHIYAIGKDEKISATTPDQRRGLVVGN